MITFGEGHRSDLLLVHIHRDGLFFCAIDLVPRGKGILLIARRR
jgi:hypothetical protein